MLLFLERRREKGLMKEEAKEKIINTFQIVTEVTFSGVTHTPYKETGKKKHNDTKDLQKQVFLFLSFTIPEIVSITSFFC